MRADARRTAWSEDRLAAPDVDLHVLQEITIGKPGRGPLWSAPAISGSAK